MSIPIKQAEGFAIANDLTQIIIFGHDGHETHVLTWGDTAEHAAQAATGANAIKKKWGWPDDLQAVSARVLALEAENKVLHDTNAELLAQVKKMELNLYDSPRAAPTVHVVEATEHESGWGVRFDGLICFPSEAKAKEWIAEYSKRHHTSSQAPSIYVTHEYIGIKECSDKVLRHVTSNGLMHLWKQTELTA